MSKIASPKSASWARSILTERDVSDLGVYARDILAAIDAGTATQSDVSMVIDCYRNAPRLAIPRAAKVERAGLPDVPAGRYALVDEHGTTKFYKVDRPDKGKWEGWTFLKALASDTEYPIRNEESRRAILAEIASDVQGALARYGHEIGACGVCGRTLTDEASRAAGIGPICADRLGF
jgi:Family of unknown function (DUF6011)